MADAYLREPSGGFGRSGSVRPWGVKTELDGTSSTNRKEEGEQDS